MIERPTTNVTPVSACFAISYATLSTIAETAATKSSPNAVSIDIFFLNSSHFFFPAQSTLQDDATLKSIYAIG